MCCTFTQWYWLPENMEEGTECVLTLLKNVTFFHSKLLLDNSASFSSTRLKDVRQNWKVKLTFRGTYRLLGIGIVECLKTIDIGCNLKQFDGLTWLTLTPIFYDRSTLLDWTWDQDQLLPVWVAVRVGKDIRRKLLLHTRKSQLIHGHVWPFLTDCIQCQQTSVTQLTYK